MEINCNLYDSLTYGYSRSTMLFSANSTIKINNINNHNYYKQLKCTLNI